MVGTFIYRMPRIQVSSGMSISDTAEKIAGLFLMAVVAIIIGYFAALAKLFRLIS